MSPFARDWMLRNKWYLGFALLSLLVTVLVQSASSTKSKEGSAPGGRLEGIDTYIPIGYVLVPIEVENLESLNGLMEDFGVADLYTSSRPGQGVQTLVAENVRLLRAPLNPHALAVLCKEEEAPKLLSHAGPFFVTLRRPEKAGTHFESKFINHVSTPPLPQKSALRKRRLMIELPQASIQDPKEEMQ